MTVLDVTTGSDLETRVVVGRLRTTVYLDGELGHRTASALRDALRDAVRHPPRNVVVDCSSVTAMTDVGGLAPLVAAMHGLHRRGGRLWLADPTGLVADALRDARLVAVADTGTPLLELVTS